MLAKKLKNYRINSGLKMQEVSEKTGINQSLISKFEGGTRNPTKQQIAKLSEVFCAKDHDLMKSWFSDKILSDIKNYPFADEVLTLVAEEISDYQKLLREPVDQTLPKTLLTILTEIDSAKNKIDALKPLNKTQLLKLNEYFFTDYTYESNKIEGNTLNLQETAMIIKEGVTIGGKSVREHLEVINHKEAIDFVSEIAGNKIDLNERTIKDLHYLVLKGILNHDAGKYRNADVRITSRKHEPPAYYDVQLKMESLLNYYQMHQGALHPVILSADMHQILLGIHPFIDGNGRTSRLLMNLVLLKNGYYIANIKGSLGSRVKYYNALEKAHVKGQLTEFRTLVAKAVKHSLTEFYNLVKSK